MPLTRDRIIGHDNERLAFRFTMLNNADTVECQISDAALDELGGVKGTESMARQAQFLALRDAVESIASEIFQKAPHVKGQVVRIFTKHVQKPLPLTDPIPAGPGAGMDNAATLRVIAETRPATAAQ
ncbi:DUF1488 family protein [Bradyrhizobium sp. CB3481]|uniref:DUF1488 family protein n=1 Tax=Bradyrhizobium sp. CB3481 TaxID=3039158 RepID=UPI0024B07D06|nr:DUF1488 family protein [Bradyrhizobium sp. CB3481]WFU14977.1 DUF1488 family protein [Bradyrhizobium sp. CB3481]